MMETALLENLGFQHNEAKVYLALLEHGALSPYELADKTGLNRSYLYDLLNRMVERGFVNIIKLKNKQHFQATTPKNLQKLFELRAEEFQQLIPQLEALKRVEETEVELHKGTKVYYTLIKDILTTITEESVINIIIPDEHEYEKLEPIIIQQYFRRLRELKVTEKVLTKKGGYKFKTPTTTYKELPGEVIGNTGLFIYEDKVAEIVLGNPNYMVIIKNEALADTKRKLFNFLWSFPDDKN